MKNTSTSSRGLKTRDSARTTYLQVGSLVDHLKEQHLRLSETYRAEKDSSRERGGDRLDLLFGYLVQRQEDLEQFLERFPRDEREGILETWIQYIDLSDLDRKVDEMVEHPAQDPRRAIADVSELDRELSLVYQRLEEKTTAPTVQRFFRDLREKALERARQHAESLQQVEDL